MGLLGMRWCAVAVVTAALTACGSASSTSTDRGAAPGSSSPSAGSTPSPSTGSGTAQATSGASSTTLAATATAPSPIPTATSAQLVAVVEQVYVRTSGGDYAACDAGSDMSFPQCPFTDRLRARVAEIYAQQRASPGAGYADAVCGCQNSSRDLQTVAAPDAAGGGDVRVSLFGGSDHINVLIVAQSGRLLVDDLVFCSADPPSSIYAGTPARC